jgi:SAM-dependent methyltransferase
VCARQQKERSVAPPQSKHKKSEGSQLWFDEQWQVGHRDTRYLYPRETPRTQWELFEREKALHIDRLLETRRLYKGLALECGCGTAGMSVYLANKGFGSVATDTSTAALALARLNADDNCLPEAVGTVSTAAADVRHLPFPDDVFDVVMSHGLLEHFHRDLVGPVLREMVRVLTPGGLFLADIAHGCFSVRKLARWVEFPVSCVYYLCRADRGKLRALWRSRTDGFYENDLDDKQWEEALRLSTLAEVELDVLRPFPPFALTPALDRLYVRFMERLLPLWRRFDDSQSRLTRRWGWLYLAHGTKHP